MNAVILACLLGAGAPAAPVPDDNTFADLVGADVVVSYRPSSRLVAGAGTDEAGELESASGTLVRVTKGAVVVRTAAGERSFPRDHVWSIVRAKGSAPVAVPDKGEGGDVVPEAHWKVMVQGAVVLTLVGDKHLHGKLAAEDADTATIIRGDGKIVTVKKADVTDLAADVEGAKLSAPARHDVDVADDVDRQQASQELRYAKDALQQTQDIAWIGPALTVVGVGGALVGAGIAGFGQLNGRADLLATGAAVGITGGGAVAGGLFYWWFNGHSQDELQDQIRKARFRAASIDEGGDGSGDAPRLALDRLPSFATDSHLEVTRAE